MSNYDNPYATDAGHQASTSYPLQTGANPFFTSVQDIKDDLKDYNALIDQLERLQTSSLNAIGTQEVQSLQGKINQTNTNLSDLQKNTIHPKLKELYKICGQDKDKQSQAENLTQQFKTAINKARTIESNYKQQNTSKAIDQYKIVNPNASYDEAAEFVNNAGNEQVFDSAIAQSNRRGESMSVLQEVQARHQEVERTERMAAELRQLFDDLQDLVFEQDQMFDDIEQNVAVAQENQVQGDKHVVKAVKTAKKNRRLKWILFWIIVIIICAIIGGVVGGVVGSRNK
ncbi:unnamed protein product [Ambrosiozyma monospora]|uniref:Unnamed protein product n=1 Tax=Ambrosiozyma monospora TaxID=43982 RepID=A0A9W7DCY4_AMBMO|nr:unnamed protein product [Ambrosiozyma monospora]